MQYGAASRKEIDDLFRIVTVEMPETLDAFVERAAVRSREQVNPFDMTGFEGRDA